MSRLRKEEKKKSKTTTTTKKTNSQMNSTHRGKMAYQMWTYAFHRNSLGSTWTTLVGQAHLPVVPERRFHCLMVHTKWVARETVPWIFLPLSVSPQREDIPWSLGVYLQAEWVRHSKVPSTTVSIQSQTPSRVPGLSPCRERIPRRNGEKVKTAI